MLRAYREFMPQAPRALNGFFAYLTVPPDPSFPAELHGRSVCGVVWAHVGDESSAARAMAPLLDSLPEPLLHGPAAMPHAAFQSAFDALYPKGHQWYWRADFVNEIPDGGKIIAQKAVDILPGDTAEILQRRVMEQAEWILLPQAAETVCAGL